MMEKKGKRFDSRFDEICESDCQCYKCNNNCYRCDGCGDTNYIDGCDRFTPKEK